jgi:hypothetical protein
VQRVTVRSSVNVFEEKSMGTWNYVGGGVTAIEEARSSRGIEEREQKKLTVPGLFPTIAPREQASRSTRWTSVHCCAVVDTVSVWCDKAVVKGRDGN